LKSLENAGFGPSETRILTNFHESARAVNHSWEVLWIRIRHSESPKFTRGSGDRRERRGDPLLAEWGYRPHLIFISKSVSTWRNATPSGGTSHPSILYIEARNGFLPFFLKYFCGGILTAEYKMRKQRITPKGHKIRKDSLERH
jgi:hypothetical protein